MSGLSAQWAVGGAGLAYGANMKILWLIVAGAAAGYFGPQLTSSMSNANQVNYAVGAAGIGAAGAKLMGYNGDKVWIGAAVLAAVGYYYAAPSTST